LNKVKAIAIYYGQVLVLNIMCSLLACKTIDTYGWEPFPKIFGFKIITLLLALYFNNVYRGKEIYFYYNLGIRKEVMWGAIIIADTLIFILVLFLFFQPK
jgi:hypothetical protein